MSFYLLLRSFSKKKQRCEVNLDYIFIDAKL